MTKICRTCLKVGNNESCDFTHLNSVVSEATLSTKDKLLECIPELSISLVQDPFMCNSCLTSLEIMYEFWNTCLQTEEKIRNYMQKNAHNHYVDLSRVVAMDEVEVVEVKQDILPVEDECIEVECITSEMQEDPDLVDVNYLVPVLIHEEDDGQVIKVEANDADDSCNIYGYSETTDDYANKNEEIIEVLIKSENADENSENESQFKSHVCHKCNHCFTTKSSLKRHMGLHLQSNKWKKVAKKRTTLPLTKLNEYLSHENIKEKCHVCHVCDKSFIHSRNLKIHMTVHTGEKPFKCDTCNKQFNFKNNLHRHTMVMHESGHASRRFKCDVCDKSFTRNEHLRKHVISHTEDMRYQCTLCKKLFKYKDSLRGHLKYHNGEKRFRCDICGNGFIRRDNLHAHLRTVHVNPKSFECTVCDEKYLENDIFKEHLKRHTDILNYKCETCDKLFRTKQRLQVHMNTHLVEKPYKCSICEHTFSQKGTLTQHFRTHTGEKPFICFLCEKSFTQKASLRTHLQRHRDESGHLIKEENKEGISGDLLP